MIDTRFYTTLAEGMSLGDLCAKLDIAPPDGSIADAVVFRPAALATAGTGDIAFLDNKRLAHALETGRPTACLTTDRLAAKVGATGAIPLIVGSPRYAIARATDLLVGHAATPAAISPEADVHPTAVIGPGVTIGARTIVGPNAVIERAVIGEGCTIGACSVIGGAGFGVVMSPSGTATPIPHVGRVVIGDQVRIGSNVCIDRGQLGDTQIMDSCQIDNLVQIAHNCVLERNCMLAGQVGLSGSCHIEEGVMMGGSVGLADHIRVGKGARLAAYAGVMNDIPAGETWSGIPAMPIREHLRIVATQRRAIKK